MSAEELVLICHLPADHWQLRPRGTIQLCVTELQKPPRAQWGYTTRRQMRQSSAAFKYWSASLPLLWWLAMIVTSLFPHPCAFINPFSSFAWLGRERNSAVADSADNVLKSAISWHVNFPLFSKDFGGAVLNRHFYSPISKKKPKPNKTRSGSSIWVPFQVCSKNHISFFSHY